MNSSAHENSLSLEEINELEQRRIKSLDEDGINEVEVLAKANEHMNMWNSYFNENITRGKDDVNFVVRDQWTAVERSEFTRLFKPAMTFNKLYDTIKKILAEQRKNKPDLIVRSLTGKATQEQINIREDLVRTISYNSQNDLVYQTAFKSALMMGFGALQVCIDYETNKSFNKVIGYKLITDADRCFFDLTAIKPHKGDGNYCGKPYVFTKDEFFSTYPYITNPVSFVDPYMLLDYQTTTRDTVVVLDYFVKEWFSLNIYKLSDGRSVTEEEWEKIKKVNKEQQKIVEGAVVSDIIKNDMPTIVRERQTQDYKIIHYRLLQNQIIDYSEWPSKQLPIIFVDGNSEYIEGRQYTRSFIRDARDAQKFINYVGSEIAAEIKNRRREQWMGTPDNIIGYEQEWRNPELQIGMLRAKPDPKTGLMPQKMPPWDLSPALLQHFQRGTQDIKEILGFSESEQIEGRDISGKARRERKLEGSMSAYVFLDNLNQAVAQAGRVVLDLLPYIAGEDERNMIVSKKDGKTDSIMLNERADNGNVKNQLDNGEYDIEIDSGPSFAVQKDIALEFFQQTIAANPEVFNLVADLWAGNLDIAQMTQVKERLTNLVPPDILAKEQGKPAPPKPPSMQEQMMQQEMQIKQAQLQERAEELKIRQQKHELEKAQLVLDARKMQADMQMDQKQHHTDIAKAEMDYSAKIAGIIADMHKDESRNRLDHSHHLDEMHNRAKERTIVA